MVVDGVAQLNGSNGPQVGSDGEARGDAKVPVQISGVGRMGGRCGCKWQWMGFRQNFKAKKAEVMVAVALESCGVACVGGGK